MRARGRRPAILAHFANPQSAELQPRRFEYAEYLYRRIYRLRLKYQRLHELPQPLQCLRPVERAGELIELREIDQRLLPLRVLLIFDAVERARTGPTEQREPLRKLVRALTALRASHRPRGVGPEQVGSGCIPVSRAP